VAATAQDVAAWECDGLRLRRLRARPRSVELRRDGAVQSVELRCSMCSRCCSRSGIGSWRRTLLGTVWGDRFVGESTLTSRVKAARRVIGDVGTKTAVHPPVRRRRDYDLL